MAKVTESTEETVEKSEAERAAEAKKLFAAHDKADANVKKAEADLVKFKNARGAAAEKILTNCGPGPFFRDIGSRVDVEHYVQKARGGGYGVRVPKQKSGGIRI